MKKDTICKEVLKTIVVDIAKYILELDGALTDEDLTFIDKETLRIEQRRADIVAKVHDSYILHLEIQNHNNPDMPLRMMRYYTEIRLATHMPVRSTPEKPAAPYPISLKTPPHQRVGAIVTV